jgi:hypothetical protein
MLDEEEEAIKHVYTSCEIQFHAGPASWHVRIYERGGENQSIELSTGSVRFYMKDEGEALRWLEAGLLAVQCAIEASDGHGWQSPFRL